MGQLPARLGRGTMRADGKAADLDLVEINEAFAAVGLSGTRHLGVGPDRVNVDGGAIAVGHPLGMSGARIVLNQ